MSAPFRLTAPPLAALSGVAHGFFGRAGGVSTGVYESLNTGLGSDDDPDAVNENRVRCAVVLGVAHDRLLTCRQVHSPIVVYAAEPWEGPAPEADAILTDAPGLAVGALAADCMPVLFAEPDAGLVASAHAGWRGALAGVLEATVEEMAARGAVRERIIAALGPCLRRENFEVGLDLVDAFTEKYPYAETFFHDDPARADKRRLDLAAYASWRLDAVGVALAWDAERCTLGEPDVWFSHRHSKKTGARDYGRNLSAIALA
ncbi:MAG: peptidoglycan editing factor PgeF [Pseudomonadota bacterium]